MFEITAQDREARTGLLHTAHGKLKTPFYMPVGTKASVKNISPEELKSFNTECIICNAFHLLLSPGSKVIQEFGGLHRYMNWEKGIFTDSGGFQVLSEEFLLERNDKRILFQDTINNRKHELTPEDSMQIQLELGSDVAMALDDVPHFGKDYDYIQDATRRTHLWAERCLEEHNRLKEIGIAKINNKQLLFGITQGGTFPDLRKASAKKINELDFDGIAFGGLCIGEEMQKTFDMVRLQIPLLGKEKARYVMGMGTPEEILECISMGIDCFDSIFPTQNARRGSLFTKKGIMHLNKGRFKYDFNAIDEDCECYTCKNFSRSYVYHLLDTKELFGLRLATIHNLHFIQKLVTDARAAIEENRFEKYKKEFLAEYKNQQSFSYSLGPL
ncbi:tRNA guanosine(34) transglycosylase Tgt [Candidatus Woesearchaeota archaeon]|nr:tRNA guanosine(34) transglycosylase Tgt [Candidatus Woesearchaeota archaeon]